MQKCKLADLARFAVCGAYLTGNRTNSGGAFASVWPPHLGLRVCSSGFPRTTNRIYCDNTRNEASKQKRDFADGRRSYTQSVESDMRDHHRAYRSATCKRYHQLNLSEDLFHPSIMHQIGSIFYPGAQS
jgi:hypothetical protein